MSLHDHTESRDASGLAQQQSMDRMYRLQRHIYDASRRFYLLGRDDLIARLGVPVGGTVLEVGCGTGRNLVKVSDRYPSSFVHGFDISDEMLKTASAAIGRAGLTSRICVAQGDALAFDPVRAFGVDRFDRVYCSYTLSMIPAWQQVIASAVRCLAPGGELHIVDFGQCERLPGAVRRGLFAWLRQFHVVPRADLRAVCEQVAAEQGFSAAFTSCHGGYDWLAAIRRPG